MTDGESATITTSERDYEGWTKSKAWSGGWGWMEGWGSKAQGLKDKHRTRGVRVTGGWIIKKRKSRVENGRCSGGCDSLLQNGRTTKGKDNTRKLINQWRARGKSLPLKTGTSAAVEVNTFTGKVTHSQSQRRRDGALWTKQMRCTDGNKDRSVDSAEGSREMNAWTESMI